MLVKDPKKRINAKDAKNHKFFEPLMSETFDHCTDEHIEVSKYASDPMTP